MSAPPLIGGQAGVAPWHKVGGPGTYPGSYPYGYQPGPQMVAQQQHPMMMRRMVVMPQPQMQAPPTPQRVMVCPRPVMHCPCPPRHEVLVERPVVREKRTPKYILPVVVPPVKPAEARKRIIIRDRRPRARPPPPPPPPPIFIMAPPQQKCCGGCGPAPVQQVVAREPRQRSDLNWFGRVEHLDDDSLAGAAALAAAALAAPDEHIEREEDVMDVTVPNGAREGDTIDVKLPCEYGGGTMCVTVPCGRHPGSTFEVPLGRTGKRTVQARPRSAPGYPGNMSRMSGPHTDLIRGGMLAYGRSGMGF